jgi:hypothetical protein
LGKGIVHLLNNVLMGEPEDLAHGFRLGEQGLGLGHFAELAVVGFDRIGGIDQPSDFGRVVEKGYVFMG